MCDYITVFKADDFAMFDFGIVKVGNFDELGLPRDWLVNVNQLDHELPRFLKKEPVMELVDNADMSVYLRGLYSEILSKKRRAAFLGHT